MLNDSANYKSINHSFAKARILEAANTSASTVAQGPTAGLGHSRVPKKSARIGLSAKDQNKSATRAGTALLTLKKPFSKG